MEQGGQFRAKGKDPVPLKPIERLLAKAVAGQKKPPSLFVKDRKGEHAVEALQETLPPGTIAQKQHLGVGVIGLENMSQALKLGPQFGVIVNLAIEDNREFPVACRHRLRTAGEIDEGKTAMSKVNSRLRRNQIPLSIWPAMSQSTGHLFQNLPIPRTSGGDKSGDAAH